MIGRKVSKVKPEKVVDVISQWGGKVIDVLYRRSVSTSLNKAVMELGTTPQIRLGRLRRLLDAKSLVRFLDVHHALSGLIIEHTTIKVDGKEESFDGMWGSSLTDSTAKGKPDMRLWMLAPECQL